MGESARARDAGFFFVLLYEFSFCSDSFLMRRWPCRKLCSTLHDWSLCYGDDRIHASTDSLSKCSCRADTPHTHSRIVLVRPNDETRNRDLNKPFILLGNSLKHLTNDILHNHIQLLCVCGSSMLLGISVYVRVDFGVGCCQSSTAPLVWSVVDVNANMKRMNWDFKRI